jgi:hypothetical protein
LRLAGALVVGPLTFKGRTERIKLAASDRPELDALPFHGKEDLT